MGLIDKVFGKNKDTSKKSLTHIFISYGSKDSDVAEEIYDLLASINVKCWIVSRDLKSPENYSEEMENALNRANILIFISSKNSGQSKYVLNELEYAANTNIPIITFKIDDFLPEERWMFFLNNSRLIEAYPDYSSHYEDLLNALREEYNSQGLYRVIDMSTFKNGGIDNNEDTQKIASLKKPFKAYNGNKPYIFVSYAHKDAESVFKEIKKFHDEGYPIWYDQGLTAGMEWDEEIEEALLNSSLLVVFISKMSMSRSNVVDEIKLALEEEIDIVPIYLEEAELAKGLKLRLSQKHAIFKYSSDEEDFLAECFKAFDKAGILRD